MAKDWHRRQQLAVYGRGGGKGAARAHALAGCWGVEESAGAQRSCRWHFTAPKLPYQIHPHPYLVPAANVLLKSAEGSSNGYVAKIADFGLSQMMDPGQTRTLMRTMGSVG